MKRNLAQAHAREAAALNWLRFYEPDDGHGVIGEGTAYDPASMFTQPVVIDAYLAGADQAESDFAIERATGQRQLDDASALMTEAAELFRSYERHHRGIAAKTGARTGREEKAERNALMAARLEAWLAGEERYPVSPEPFDAEACRARVDTVVHLDVTQPIPAEIAASGDIVPAGVSNIRPVTDGPMADQGMIEQLVEALGGPARSLSTVKAGAFRLQTCDPRFDPVRPVVVNGFIFIPATEA
jgi:hypothetical protein